MSEVQIDLAKAASRGGRGPGRKEVGPVKRTEHIEAANAWLGAWPIGKECSYRGHQHCIVVTHLVGRTGFPVIKVAEEETGGLYWVFYGSRQGLGARKCHTSRP